MVSQTVIETNATTAFLRRWIKNSIVIVEFPLTVTVKEVEEYFNMHDEEFYLYRARSQRKEP